MKLTVVPMTTAHYLEAAHAVNTSLWLGAQETARQHQSLGPAYAGFWGEHLVGVAGVMLLWPGMGEAWAIITVAGRQHPLIVHRTVVRTLDTIIAEKGLHRVQAHVLKDFALGRTWVHRLGFRREATLRRYGPDGADFVQYVRLP